LQLDTLVQYVKGVGPVRAEQLATLGVVTLWDLLTYYPRRYDLRRQAQSISTLRGEEEAATIAGEVVEVNERQGGRVPYLQCGIDDGTGCVLVKWFHGGYLRDQVRDGAQVAVSGKTTVFKENIQFINPKVQVIHDPSGTDLSQDELLPVYPAGGRLTSAIIGYIIKKVLPQAQELVRETLGPEFLSKRGLMNRWAAITAMHRPEDKEQWGSARRRLAYDECMLMQLGIAINRMREVSRPARPLGISQEIDARIRARFPFKLTDAQDKTVTEIVADLQRSRPMNRLLQGDVGCGKTVVALYASLMAVANHKQAAIMAPTEILAQQHYRKICDYLSGSKVRSALLVGGQNDRERSAVIAGLAAGSIDIVVGTQALLSADVRFAELALVVIDEQHKFGVRQRTGIRGKGFAPHYLVMTATPIPRTLAMTVFGDLDISVIDKLPPGRGTTRTKCVNEKQLPQVMQMVRKSMEGGNQAYFIYPLVNPSPDVQLHDAQQAYVELAQGALKDFRVGLIHGQMPADEKDRVMWEFRAGNIDALVASVVVEVGVDVPAANIMVVMHAERFGLAQLHQLRGRIGRSTKDATCILVAAPNNPNAQKRLEVLEQTHDGFKIAEEDLRLRGPGEFFGTRQHGLPELKVAELIEDFDLLRLARRDAFAIIQEDPGLNNPHNQQLRTELIAAYGGKLNLLTGA
jgi:ATP-dependent DNA helicase RecG